MARLKYGPGYPDAIPIDGSMGKILAYFQVHHEKTLTSKSYMEVEYATLPRKAP